MKRLMTLAAATLLLSSCSKYYVSTLESSNTKKSEETGSFIFENDTLSVTYNFNGKNAPINITMRNKLNEPLYIDWEKSALIKGDETTPFSGKEIKINAGINSSTYPNFVGEGSTQSGTLTTKIALPETVGFIPPKSTLTKIPLPLSERHSYGRIAKSSFEKSQIPLNNGPDAWAKSASFNGENSPLSFKSYLTFYTEKDNKRKDFPVVQHFYLSNLIQTYTNPKNFSSMGNKPGNVFYNSRSTAFGSMMTSATLAAIVVVGISMSMDKSQ